MGSWLAGGGKSGRGPYSCPPWKAAAAPPFQPPCVHPGVPLSAGRGPSRVGGALCASKAHTVAGQPLFPRPGFQPWRAAAGSGFSDPYLPYFAFVPSVPRVVAVSYSLNLCVNLSVAFVVSFFISVFLC